jgi:hypothetical protein
MTNPQGRSAEVANRMAGWFFLVAGALLVVLAFALLPTWRVVAWSLGVAGLAALAFGVLAPRRVRVAALDAVVSFVLAM